jgi:hypothetical protein
MRTAADLFLSIEPLDDTSAGEMRQAIQESRQISRMLEATQEPPKLKPPPGHKCPGYRKTAG